MVAMLVQRARQAMKNQNIRRAKFCQRWRLDAIPEGAALALAAVGVVEEAVVMVEYLQCLNATATPEPQGLQP